MIRSPFQHVPQVDDEGSWQRFGVDPAPRSRKVQLQPGHVISGQEGQHAIVGVRAWQGGEKTGVFTLPDIRLFVFP